MNLQLSLLKLKILHLKKIKNQWRPVYINYIFRGLKEGKTTITFKYINVIDDSIEKEDKVRVKVDKHKNISLIAIS